MRHLKNILKDKRIALARLKKIVTRGSFAIAIAPLLISLSCTNEKPSGGHSTWQEYGGRADQSKYFEGSQITKENVKQMKVAWMYPTDDNAFYHFSPIVVDTMMFVMAKNYSLIAINALTGKEIWIHTNLRGISRRGINYWESEDKKD